MADEAHRIGMVNKVVPHDELMEETLAVADHMAAGPALAYARMKENLNKGATIDFATALDTRGDEHAALRHDAGPPGSSEGVRREAAAGVQGDLDATARQRSSRTRGAVRARAPLYGRIGMDTGNYRGFETALEDAGRFSSSR